MLIVEQKKDNEDINSFRGLSKGGSESMANRVLTKGAVLGGIFLIGLSCVVDAECSLLTKLRQQHMLNENQVIFNTYFFIRPSYPPS